MTRTQFTWEICATRSSNITRLTLTIKTREISGVFASAVVVARRRKAWNISLTVFVCETVGARATVITEIDCIRAISCIQVSGHKWAKIEKNGFVTEKD